MQIHCFFAVVCARLHAWDVAEYTVTPTKRSKSKTTPKQTVDKKWCSLLDCKNAELSRILGKVIGGGVFSFLFFLLIDVLLLPSAFGHLMHRNPVLCKWVSSQ